MFPTDAFLMMKLPIKLSQRSQQIWSMPGAPLLVVFGAENPNIKVEGEPCPPEDLKNKQE